MTGSVQIVFCMDTEGPCVDPHRSDLLPSWAEVDTAMDKLFDESSKAATGSKFLSPAKQDKF